MYDVNEYGNTYSAEGARESACRKALAASVTAPGSNTVSPKLKYAIPTYTHIYTNVQA